MKRGPKVAFGTLVILAAAAGYGVYWWHGTAKEEVPEVPAEIQEQAQGLRELVMKGDLKSKAQSRKRLGLLTLEKRIGVLIVMVADDEPGVRLFAVTNLAPFVERPVVRSLLARVVASEGDKDVKSVASRALADGSP
ncbi:MAG: hypothetical protein ISR64_05980 [Deltaproteobacteria bacterium]|nr:hypothetical protein [Deltaproteobacteria bacterium]